MHIAEGVLSAPVLITGAVVAAAGVAYGLKKIQANHFMLEMCIRDRLSTARKSSITLPLTLKTEPSSGLLDLAEQEKARF